MFLINRGELEGRLNPFFYIPYFYNREKELLASKNEVIKLKFLASKITDGTHFTPQYTTQGVKFLSVKDVREHTISFAKTKFISQEEHELLIKRCCPESGDILLTKIGTIGLAAVIPSNAPEFSLFVSVALIKLNGYDINPDYLAVFLNTNLAKFQQQRVLKGVGVPDYHLEDIRNLLVPVPTVERQKEIADFVLNAYKSKKQKLAEAQALLDKIDGYLLTELGIKRPEVVANTLENRIFTRNFSEISGRRFDPIFYLFNLDRQLGEIKTIKLKNICQYIASGFAAGANMQESNSDGVIQIRPTNINSDRELVFNKNIYVKNEFLTSKKGDLLKQREVLFNNTNSQELVGKSIFFNEEGDYFCSNHMTRIKTNSEKLEPNFLVAILNLYQRDKVFYSICTNWNNQSGVNIKLLEKLKIPLIEIEKQTEIANHIQSLREQAKHLQQQAETELQQAKNQVEKMILGEDNELSN